MCMVCLQSYLTVKHYISLIEKLSDNSKEEIEYERAYLGKNRTCDIDERYHENDSETRIVFHPFCSFVPSNFNESVSI